MWASNRKSVINCQQDVDTVTHKTDIIKLQENSIYIYAGVLLGTEHFRPFCYFQTIYDA